MNTAFVRLVIAASILAAAPFRSFATAADSPTSPPILSEGTVRVAAVQAKRRSIDYRLKPLEVLAAVDRNLDELDAIVQKAADQKCQALAFPEDTLGLLDWTGMNESVVAEVLPEAVRRMLDRLGRAASRHGMVIVVCSDFLETDGGLYNTAFLIDRDGKEAGRYHKTCPTWFECGARQRGSSFPVFAVPGLGTVGMLICYDLVFPETARCLALAGADIIFFPTMGMAAVGDDDIGLQAVRVRAAENQVWLVMAHRGHGAMIISPRGKIVARADGPDGLAIADIDVHGGRAGGDSANWQRDMRARLFRERNPAAFTPIIDPHPAILDKVPIDITQAEGARIFARMLTVGEEQFNRAAALARAGKTSEAIAAFEQLRVEYRGSWIDRVSTERLIELRRKEQDQPCALDVDPDTNASAPDQVRSAPAAGNVESNPQRRPNAAAPHESGIAAQYPGDRGIERDSRVVFVENFEEDSLDSMASRWETVGNREIMTLCNDGDVPVGSGGRQSLLMDRREGPGGQLYRRIKNESGGWGYDQLFVRYYVKFASDSGELGHGTSAVGGNNPAVPWPKVNAGVRPDGASSFWSGIEPFGTSWTWDYYTYWCEMRGSPPRGQTWGNVFIRDPSLRAQKGKWICIEHMMKVNDVDDSNGEQALWIDGKQVSHLGKGYPAGLWTFDKFHPGKGGPGIRWNDEQGGREEFEVPSSGSPFEGFRWRTDPALNLNFVWLYIYTQKPAGHRMRVWFDDLVIAKQHIGPIAE
jgi:predicted amidohydrolase